MKLQKSHLLLVLGLLFSLPAAAMPFIRLGNGMCLYFGDQGIYLRKCADMGDGLAPRSDLAAANFQLDRGDGAEPSRSSIVFRESQGAAVQRGYTAPAAVSPVQLESSQVVEASMGAPLTGSALKQQGIEGLETCVVLPGAQRRCFPTLGGGNLPYVPLAQAVMVVTKENAGHCKGEIWVSNGVGAKEGTNCPQGRLCCDKKITASRGTAVDAAQLSKLLGAVQTQW